MKERKKGSRSSLSFIRLNIPRNIYLPAGYIAFFAHSPLSDGDTWARVFHQGRGHYRTEGQRVISPAVPSPQPPNIRALLIDTIAT